MNNLKHSEEFLRQINNCEGILQKICRVYFDNEADQQDIYQEILLNAWKGYPVFRGDSAFSTWFYRIAINTAFNKLRSKKRIKESSITTSVLSIPENYIPQEKEDASLLYKALNQLNEVDKTVAFLYLDQLSYKEIAAVTGLPEVGMGSRIRRVKEKLKKILLRYGIR